MRQSIHIKEDGKWVKYIPEPVLTFVRYQDYGYNGHDVLFATTDRARAFKVEERDDVWGYTRIRVFKDTEIEEEWAWSDSDKDWWKVR